MTSQVRQNFHPDSEDGINDQINKELHASYVYQAMSYYFNRDDVALEGFRNFFNKQSQEEKEHAEKLMKYQNKRGGRIILKDIAKPSAVAWTPEAAFESALSLEKEVNQSLLNLHKIAETHDDPNMTDYNEEFLEEQVDSMEEIADHITNICRNGPGIGVYLYDKFSLKE